MEKKEQKSYIISFDIMNIIACFSVVALHINGSFWVFERSNRWICNNIVECIGYFAVPVFFMLSGATLMDYRERYSTKEYFKKRFLKTLIPFLVWSVFAICYYIYFNGTSYFNSDKNIIINYFDIIINTKANTLYWFFLPLFAVYLSIPIISAIDKQKRIRIFFYAVLVAFFTYSVLPTVFTLFGIVFSPQLQIPIAGGYIIFVLLGYLVVNYKLQKKHRIIIYLAGFAGLLIHFSGTVLMSFKAGQIIRTFKDYVNFPTVLYSLAIFVFIYYRDWSFIKSPNVIKLIRKVSSASFGVYLIHYFVLNLFVMFFKIDTIKVSWILWGTPVIYLISLLIVLIIKKIPILKYIVP